MKKSKTGVSGHKTDKHMGQGGDGMPKKAMAATKSAGPKDTSSSVHSHAVTKKHQPVKKAAK